MSRVLYSSRDGDWLDVQLSTHVVGTKHQRVFQITGAGSGDRDTYVIFTITDAKQIAEAIFKELDKPHIRLPSHHITPKHEEKL